MPVFNGNFLPNSILGSMVNDTINGFGGNDTLEGNFSSDVINGGTGNDLIFAMTQANPGGSVVGDTLNGESGNDTIVGSGGNDTANGGANNDSIDGGVGNDLLQGGRDADTLNGGIGNDSIFANTQASPDASPAGDGLNGDAGDDVIRGSAGNDTANGGSGLDLIEGGAGNDLLTGGAGIDTFTFDTPLSPAFNVDGITDFFSPDDLILLENAVFAGLPVGGLAAGAFRSGAAALDATDRIIYNPNIGGEGQLYFDPDGAGGAAQTLFATVNAFTPINFTDFVVM